MLGAKSAPQASGQESVRLREPYLLKQVCERITTPRHRHAFSILPLPDGPGINVEDARELLLRDT